MMAPMKVCFPFQSPVSEGKGFPIADDFEKKGTVVQEYSNLIKAGLRAKGRDPDITLKYKDWLRKAGMIDVVEQTFQMPINPWSTDPKLRRIGRFFLSNAQSGIRAAGWQLFHALGLSPDEIETKLEDVRRGFFNTDTHIYCKL